MNKEIELSLKQIKRLSNYKRGDILNISTITYAFLQREYIDNIDRKKKNKYRAFQAEINSHEKPNRPVIVLFNNPKSNLMLLASLTSSGKNGLNFDIRELNNGSFINYQVLIFNKKRHKITYDGMVFNTIDSKTMDKYFIELKKNRPLTFQYQIELINKILDKIIQKYE